MSSNTSPANQAALFHDAGRPAAPPAPKPTELLFAFTCGTIRYTCELKEDGGRCGCTCRPTTTSGTRCATSTSVQSGRSRIARAAEEGGRSMGRDGLQCGRGE